MGRNRENLCRKLFFFFLLAQFCTCPNDTKAFSSALISRKPGLLFSMLFSCLFKTVLSHWQRRINQLTLSFFIFFFLRSWSLFIAPAWSRNEQSPAQGCSCSLPLTLSHMGQLYKAFLMAAARLWSPSSLPRDNFFFIPWQITFVFAKANKRSQPRANERANPSHLLQSLKVSLHPTVWLRNTQGNSRIF